MGQGDRGYDISTVARLMLPSDEERSSINLLDVLDCDPERMEPIFTVTTPAERLPQRP